MRARSQTIGTLGRAPARQTKDPQPPRLPPLPPTPSGHEPGSIRRWIRGALFENVGLKFLSMVLAITVFLLVNGDKDAHRDFTVGVSYLLPADKVLVSERYDEVRVTLRGAWRRLRQVEERELDRITIDLRNAPTGEVAFTSDMLRVPAGIKVVSIQPRTMRVAFDKRQERIVEVAPVTGGHPQHGYRVVEVKSTPATASLRGADKVLGALGSVRTTEISLEGRTETFSVQVPIVPPEGVEATGTDVVNVEIKIDQELVQRKLHDVPVLIVADGVDSAKWTVTPQTLEVTLIGPLLAIEKAKDGLAATVRVTPADRASHIATVEIEGVPPGLGVRLSPERVKVAPTK